DLRDERVRVHRRFVGLLRGLADHLERPYLLELAIAKLLLERARGRERGASLDRRHAASTHSWIIRDRVGRPADNGYLLERDAKLARDDPLEHGVSAAALVRYPGVQLDMSACRDAKDHARSPSTHVSHAERDTDTYAFRTDGADVRGAIVISRCRPQLREQRRAIGSVPGLGRYVDIAPADDVALAERARVVHVIRADVILMGVCGVRV